MAWDFSTEPEFQRQLDWMRDFVREEIWTIETIFGDLGDDAFRRLIAAGEIPPGLALDDHAAALIADGELVEAVRSREGAAAHRVIPDGEELAREEPLTTRLLPAPNDAGETGLSEMRELRRARERSAPAPGRKQRREREEGGKGGALLPKSPLPHVSYTSSF